MTAVTVIVIILIVLAAMSLLRFGVEAEYSDEGVFVSLFLPFGRISLLPKKRKKEKGDK